MADEDDIDSFPPDPWVDPVSPFDNRQRFLQPKENWAIAFSRTGDLIRNRYNYTLLRGDEIRLLSISKGNKEAPLNCKMLIKPLKDVRKKYNALSYHWGSNDAGSAKNMITIVDAQPSLAAVVGHAMGKGKPNDPIPKQFFIHDNLNSALRHLRQENRPVFIWVDAICINQRETPDGEEEKKQQVQRMAEIYNSAANVCVWLGPGLKQTDIAMDFIQEIVNLEKFDSLIKQSESIPKWEALTDLMKCEWFSRRWVVQEVALARRATVHCGSKIVHWNDFADAVALFMTKLDQIKNLFSGPDALSDVEALGAIVLVGSISNLARKSADGNIQEHLVGLETLVSSLLFFSVSNAHDAIYSLLSLARDTPQRYCTDRHASLVEEDSKNAPFIMEVDYKRNPIEVFIEFTKQCIKTSGSVDIICRHWAPDVKDAKFPSWILKISDSSFGTPEDALQGRRNGDSLVGAPYRDSRKCYNASRGTIAKDVIFGPRSPADQAPGLPRRRSTGSLNENGPPDEMPSNKEYSGLLNLKGFQLASITVNSGRVIRGMINRDWLRYGGWKSSDSSEKNLVPDKLWRTLVADRGSDGGNPPGWYRRACLQCLTDIAITDVNDDMDVSYTRVSKRKSRSDITMQFLKRVRSVVWNRQFFLANLWCENCKQDGHDFLTCKRPLLVRRHSSRIGNQTNGASGSNVSGVSDRPGFVDTAPKSEQLYGIAPGNAQNGDLICILAGCTVPVVLRRHRSTTNQVHYELIGEAYVYGKMDGEAMADLDREALEDKLRWFTLR